MLWGYERRVRRRDWRQRTGRSRLVEGRRLAEWAMHCAVRTRRRRAATRTQRPTDDRPSSPRRRAASGWRPAERCNRSRSPVSRCRWSTRTVTTDWSESHECLRRKQQPTDKLLSFARTATHLPVWQRTAFRSLGLLYLFYCTIL